MIKTKAINSQVSATSEQFLDLLGKVRVGATNEMNLNKVMKQGRQQNAESVYFELNIAVHENQELAQTLLEFLNELNKNEDLLNSRGLWHWDSVDGLLNSLLHDVMQLRLVSDLTVLNYPVTQHSSGLQIKLPDRQLAELTIDNQKEYAMLRKECQEDSGRVVFWTLQKYQPVFKDCWLILTKLNVKFRFEAQQNRRQFLEQMN